MTQLRRFGYAILMISGTHTLLYATDAKSWEYWQTLGLSGRLSGKVTITLQSESRFGGGMEHFYYQYTHFELGIRMNRWLTVSPAYRQIHKRGRTAVSGGLNIEHQPQISFTGTAVWKCIEFSDRLRTERISIENRDGVQYRFRNRVKLRLPVIYSPVYLRPWIADELFYLRERDGFYRNRFYAGFESQFRIHYSVGLYFLAEEEFEPSRGYHVLGMNVKFRF